MANIRSVSLYSYQEEFFFGRLTLEGMIAEAAKTGARGIEFLAEQYAPDEYADPSDLFINEWNEWMDKYGVTPSCLDIFGDFKMFYNRDLTKKEQLDFFESNFRFAKKLGFPAVRAMIGTPVRYMPEIQALTEKYGVKFGIEMHAPYNFSTPYFQKYLEYVEKSGSKMLGIVPDMSIFTIHVPRVQMSKMLRSGAQPAVVDEICRCYEEGLSIDQADVRIQAMSANQWDNAALKAAYILRDMRLPDQFPFDFEVGVVTPPVNEPGDTCYTCGGVQFLAINPGSEHKEEAFQAMVYYMEHGAEYMVNLSVPPVAEASDELIEAFVEGTPVSVEDGAKFFDTNVQFVKSNPYEDYPNGVDYQSIMNEEAEVYFTNGQDFDTSVENIRTRSEELVASAAAE